MFCLNAWDIPVSVNNGYFFALRWDIIIHGSPRLMDECALRLGKIGPNLPILSTAPTLHHSLVLYRFLSN